MTCKNSEFFWNTIKQFNFLIYNSSHEMKKCTNDPQISLKIYNRGINNEQIAMTYCIILYLCPQRLN